MLCWYNLHVYDYGWSLQGSIIFGRLLGPMHGPHDNIALVCRWLIAISLSNIKITCSEHILCSLTQSGLSFFHIIWMDNGCAVTFIQIKKIKGQITFLCKSLFKAYFPYPLSHLAYTSSIESCLYIKMCSDIGQKSS